MSTPKILKPTSGAIIGLIFLSLTLMSTRNVMKELVSEQHQNPEATLRSDTNGSDTVSVINMVMNLPAYNAMEQDTTSDTLSSQIFPVEEVELYPAVISAPDDTAATDTNNVIFSNQNFSLLNDEIALRATADTSDTSSASTKLTKVIFSIFQKNLGNC